MSSLFQKHLSLLKKKNPVLSQKLLHAPSSPYQLNVARNGEENLLDPTSYPPRYYHSNYSPSKEALKCIETKDLEGFEVAYFYGLGLGYIAEALESFLAKDSHFLVIVEDELACLIAFLQSKRAEKILSHPRVFIEYLGDGISLENFCLKYSQYFFPLSFTCFALPLYERYKAKAFIQLRKALTYQTALINYAGKELMQHGEVYYQNFYPNFWHLKKALYSSSLHGKFQNIPAIICGAGPSLDKQLNTLPAMRHRALILSGGSGLVALSSGGVVPHIGGSVDPNPSQFSRMFAHSAFETPLFIKPRVNHQAFSLFKNPLFFLGNSSMYPLTNWMQSNLGIGETPTYKEGRNIIHLLMDVAFHMGCNPILLVGMDLSFSQQRNYAKGVLKQTPSSLPKEAFLHKSVYGQEVYTLWKWVEEASLITDYANSHPQLKLINCTEGGLGIEGIEHSSLLHVMSDYPCFDIDSYTFQCIQEAVNFQLCKKKKRESFSALIQSFERCLSFFQVKEKELITLEKEVKKRKLQRVYSKLEGLRYFDKELQAELCFDKVLKPLASMPEKIYIRRRDQISWEEHLTEAQRLEKELSICFDRLSFYQQACHKHLEWMKKEFV